MLSSSEEAMEEWVLSVWRKDLDERAAAANLGMVILSGEMWGNLSCR